MGQFGVGPGAGGAPATVLAVDGAASSRGGRGSPGGRGALVVRDGQGPRGEEGAASPLQPSAVSGEPETGDWEGQGRPRGEPVAEDRS